MSIFQLLTVLTYVTSVLTLTVTETSKNDRNPPSPALEHLFGSSQNETKDSTLLSDIRSVNHDDSDTLSKPGDTKPVVSEGGLVVGFPGAEIKSSTNPDFINKSDSSLGIPSTSSVKDNDYEKPKESSVHARKGVGNGEVKPKIVGKKGVGSYSTSTTEETIPDKELLNLGLSSTTMPPEIKPTSPVINKTEGKSGPEEIKSDKKADINSDNNDRPHLLVISHNPNDTKIHKHKPTSTTGVGDDDGKGMPSSPTQAEIGMPRKVDYIIPLVITIMATPVLGIAAYVLYTRGRDCWDKRHYSRMDFLVDGMYND